MKKYDVAAYIWPSYTPEEPRSQIFWPEGMGEWQSVRTAHAKFEGHQWPRRPLWGYVNEADPYVMEMEIAAAADHGVNVFIYDWYWYDDRPFLENCLNDGFLKAKNNSRMQFYLMWANHDANCVWDKRNSFKNGDTVVWKGSVTRSQFEYICRRLIAKYFTHPLYYKINGCPVFMIYDLQNLLNGLGSAEQTKAAFEWFRQETKNAGFPDLHLQITMWGERNFNLSGVDAGATATSCETIDMLGFDSATHYQYCHFANVDQDYSKIMPEVEREWERIDQNFHIPYFPHVSLGWDNNPRYTGFHPGVTTNNTPEEIEKALRKAKSFIDTHPEQPPLMTINSWNEWTESSYLQPDDLYGYGYLEAVKKVFIDENQ